MVERLLHVLLVQALVLALAVCVVRLLQRALLARLGAAAGYLCWLLVPVALLVVALPHPVAAPLAIHVGLPALASGWTAAAPTAGPDLAVRLGAAGLALWGLGAVALAGVLARRQSRFRALLVSTATAAAARLPAGCGPAVLGLWRPRVVLPVDFESVFDDDERRLMLLHEGVHMRRSDNLWNLLAAALLVAHWFNPFAWWAWRRFRADQESSCDAAVLRVEPSDALPVYAAALLKVQGVALAPPLATAWQSTHPLVERIRMLQHHRISSRRRRAGLRLAALFVLLAGVGAYAMDAAPPASSAAAGEPSVMMDVAIHAQRPDGFGVISCRLLMRLGQKSVVRFGGNGSVDQSLGGTPIELGLTVTRLGERDLRIEMALARGQAGAPLAAPMTAIAAPSVVTIAGSPATVGVKDSAGTYDVRVTLTPRLVDGDAGKSLDVVDVRKSGAGPADGTPAPQAF